MIQLHDLKFTPFISEEEILESIEKISEEINFQYKGKKPVFLGILNGAFLVASEIIKLGFRARGREESGREGQGSFRRPA